MRHKRPERIRLGDLLLQQKLISQEQLKAALEDQGRSGRKLGKVLIESGYLSEDQIGEALARQLSVPFINLKYYNFNSAVTRKLPEAQARRFRALLLEEQDDMVLVAMVDPTDLFAFDEISRLTRKEVNIAVVSETMLLQTIDRIYRRTDQISSLAKELGEDLGDIVDFGTLTLGAEDAPVVKLLQTMFEDAVQARASDIHIEPHEKGLHIRFRIDGLLQPQTETDAKISSAVAQRLKLMSGLDISERRLPQDGRFNVKVREQHIDVRISSMPTQYGETIVMRLLHRAGGLHQLDDLGMSPEMLERFSKAIHRYTGMVLVTGPTGSGKTTTLYAALNELNKPDCKIITVEDPVEYRLDGLNQVQVNEKIELTFGRVLRSSLRQDPDVILIGEMRDLETAEIGLRAAITGHMVLSTLHTRDAASSPLRLIDMGVPRYMVAYSLQAVVAQRLLRVNCESCSKPRQPDPQEVQWLRTVGCDPAAGRIMAGSGCQHCNGSGYSGRIGIYEMLEMDSELAALANSDDPGHFIAAAEQRMAGNQLEDSAARLAMTGKTTVSEAMRVTAQLED
ncbi:MAG: MSHA biogenesis protein MshE [Betaproteobacteria bacterium]|nr:MAG: MSHA biogenesis protein MshE [Betaproteobacteria bacterium]